MKITYKLQLKVPWLLLLIYNIIIKRSKNFVSRYIIATLGMSRKKRAWTMIFTSKSKCQYTGVTRKHVRRPRACTWPYKNIDTYRESLLNSSVSFLPWQCLGDSNPAGLFACWASDTFMRKCFGRVPTGDFPPKLKSLGTEEVCTVYVHGICFWFCLFVCMVFLKTISWWKVASASDFFENVKEFIIYLT